MKHRIINAVIRELETELARLNQANEHTTRSAVQSAPRAESQRDTSGLESAYLAHGYAQQCKTLTRQIQELKALEIEDFTWQEIDVGAVVEVEMNGETDCYILLNCGGGTQITIDGQTIIVITPESPLGRQLMGNIDAGFVTLRPGAEGIILNVY
jgi:transcription elongation GreA/GreB family factor